MQDELDRSMNELQLADLEQPYFVSYSVQEVSEVRATASLGGLASSGESASRTLQVEVRVGDRNLDNTNFSARPDFSSMEDMSFGPVSLPLDDDYEALRRALWLATDRAYKDALDRISKKRAALQNETVVEDAPDFSVEEPFKHEGGSGLPAPDAKSGPSSRSRTVCRVPRARAHSCLFGGSPRAPHPHPVREQRGIVVCPRRPLRQIDRQGGRTRWRRNRGFRLVHGLRPHLAGPSSHGRTLATEPGIGQPAGRLAAGPGVRTLCRPGAVRGPSGSGTGAPGPVAAAARPEGACRGRPADAAREQTALPIRSKTSWAVAYCRDPWRSRTTRRCGRTTKVRYGAATRSMTRAFPPARHSSSSAGCSRRYCRRAIRSPGSRRAMDICAEAVLHHPISW